MAHKAVPALLFSCALAATGWSQFVERAAAAGLNHDFISGLDRLGNLSAMADWAQVGVAVGDIDGDGWLDVVAAGHCGPNRVFHNNGDGTFADVSALSGIESPDYDSAVALGDYDLDGDLDLWLGVMGPLEGPFPGTSRLYRNDGTGVFEEVTVVAGTRGVGHSIAGKWFDLDYDGDLDMLVSEFNGAHNQYYVNNGDGSFTESGVEKGLDSNSSTHITGIIDVDEDGYVDVLVGNDYRANNLVGIHDNGDDYHLRNDGTGTFIDVTVDSAFDHGGPDGTGPGSGTMGMTFADVDYDGDLDLYKTEQDDQFLMINNGWPAGSAWTQAQDQYGVANVVTEDPADPGTFGPTVGWGCFFFDVNRDRWEDLFKVNGHVGPQSLFNQNNVLFVSKGPLDGFTFEDQTAAYGLLDHYDDRGLAASDIDQDGDIDFIVCPPGGKLRFFENQVVTSGGWLHVTADTRTSAPGGRGTVVRWTDSLGFPHVRQIGSDSPTASQHDDMVFFGLGPETQVDLTVEFPSGMTRLYPGVAANQRLTVVEPELIRLSKRTFRPLLTAQDGGTLPLLGGKADGVGVARGGASLPGGGAGGGTGGATRPAAGALADLVVTAFAHDAAGNPLGANASVAIEVPGLTPRSPARYLGGNAYERRFRTDAPPGIYRVQVSFDSFQPRIRPTVSIVGPLSTTKSEVVLDPPCVRAASADTFEVVFVPKDARGLLLGPGHQAAAEVVGFGGIPLTPMKDLGDGRYSVVLPAPSAVGFKFLSVWIDGTELFGIANVDASFQPLALNTLLYREDPHKKIALQRHQFKFLVTPRDLFGLRIGPEAAVQLVIAPSPGTEPAYERTDISPAMRRDGSIAFVVERDPSSAIGSARGAISVLVDGVPVQNLSYQF